MYRREGKRNELASERLVDILGDGVEEDYGWGYIVQVPRGRSCYFASKQTAREFSDILRQAIRQAKETPQQANLLNELERLATLYRRGALTDFEFQNAKRKLGI